MQAAGSTWSVNASNRVHTGRECKRVDEEGAPCTELTAGAALVCQEQLGGARSPVVRGWLSRS